MSYNMRVKTKNIILGLLLGLGLAFFIPQQVAALGTTTNGKNGSCSIEVEQGGYANPHCLDKQSSITVQISKAIWEDEVYTHLISVELAGHGPILKNLNSNGQATFTINGKALTDLGENKEIKFTNEGAVNNKLMCSRTVGLVKEEACTDEERVTPIDNDEPWEICNQIPETDAEGNPSDRKQKCLDCLEGNPSGIWTAIGCIQTGSTEGIIGELMTVGISIAGGIALIMILAAAFLFATSEGEPKRTSEAKEILTAAIVGLIFIIFSVTILEFIGVNILKIPGFGGS